MRLEFLRFVGVGLTNTALTLAVYWALLLVTTHSLAYVAAFVVGVAYTALANSRFTFGVTAGRRQLALYSLFCVALCVFNVLVLDLFVTFVGVDRRFAIFAVIAIGIPIGFAGARFILKR